jgi:hypothetical protein
MFTEPVPRHGTSLQSHPLTTSLYDTILVLILRAKLCRFVFVSRRYYVVFLDACRMLEGDEVFWHSLLMLVLYVMIAYSRTIVASSTCIPSWFSCVESWWSNFPLECVCVLLYACFLHTIEFSSFEVMCGLTMIVLQGKLIATNTRAICWGSGLSFDPTDWEMDVTFIFILHLSVQAAP